MAASIPSSSLITVRSDYSRSPFLSSRGRLSSSSCSSLSSSLVSTIISKPPPPIAATFFRPPTPPTLSTISLSPPRLKNPFYVRCTGDDDVGWKRIKELCYGPTSDYWIVVMDQPGGEGATHQQMIDCYIQTAAMVLGSVEEAKKRIYCASCEVLYFFGCNVDRETSKKFKGLPGVLMLDRGKPVFDSWDSCVYDLENGEIVVRHPKRLETFPVDKVFRPDEDLG